MVCICQVYIFVFRNSITVYFLKFNFWDSNQLEEEIFPLEIDEYLIGEHGNWTNAAAGYAGTNNAQGIESRWLYFKRDTVGGAGTNMGISLRVIIPSMLAYMKAFSKRHAD